MSKLKTICECDVCKSRFTPILKEMAIGDSGEITWHYFECTDCHEQYTVYFEDDHVRDIKDKIKTQEKRWINPNLDKSKINKEIDKLKAELEKGINSAKREYMGLIES